MLLSCLSICHTHLCPCCARTQQLWEVAYDSSFSEEAGNDQRDEVTLPRPTACLQNCWDRNSGFLITCAFCQGTVPLATFKVFISDHLFLQLSPSSVRMSFISLHLPPPQAQYSEPSRSRWWQSPAWPVWGLGAKSTYTRVHVVRVPRERSRTQVTSFLRPSSQPGG